MFSGTVAVVKRCWWFLLALLTFAPAVLYGESQGSFGDHLFAEGDYLRAVGEYRRMAFFASDTGDVQYFQYRIGECYRHMDDYKHARIWYDKVLLGKSGDKQLERTVLMASAMCLINGGDTEYARIMLQDLTLHGEEDDSLTFLIGVSLLKERQWNGAHNAFKQIVSPELKLTADSLFESASKHKLKSPRTALLLSTFLPGAGQLYAARPIKGLISFSLNMGLGFLTYKAFADKRNMDGFLILYFGLQRFYFGNLEQARRYTAEYNNSLNERIRVE